MANDAPKAESGTIMSRADHDQLLVEDVRALGDRRDRANQWFLSLVTLLLSAQGYLLVIYGAGEVTSTAYSVMLGLVGLYIVRMWVNALQTFKALLNLRYTILKIWEHQWFPNEHPVHVAEDALYGGFVPDDTSSLASSIASTLGANIRGQASHYDRMPSLNGYLVLGLPLIRVAVFFIASGFTLLPLVPH